MLIQSFHRSKVAIGLATLGIVMFIALSAMRAGNTEAQQNVGGFSFTPQLQQTPFSPYQPSAPLQQTPFSPNQPSAPDYQPRVLPPANGGFGSATWSNALPPNQNNSQNNPQQHPFRDGWAAPPNAVHPNHLANVFPPSVMPTAAPMTESDRRALEIANRIRQTRDNDEGEQLRKQLRETLNEAFDQRRAQQLQEMEQLERQLDSIRKLDEKRQQRKEEIVERRMSDLLSEPDALDWEPKRLQGQYGFPTSQSISPIGPGLPKAVPTESADRRLAIPPSGPSILGPSVVNLYDSTTGRVEAIGDGTLQRNVNRVGGVVSSDSTTIPQHAGDAFLYQLIESTMAQIKNLQSHRENIKGLTGVSDKQTARLSAVDARLLSSIENGRSIWRRIGKQKERDVESFAAALKHAEQRLSINRAAFEKGNLGKTPLIDAEVAVEFARANMAKAQDQLDGWKELDQRLQTALNEVGLSDPDQKAAEKDFEEAVEKDVEEAVENEGEEAVEKQEDNGPGGASVEQGAARHRLFYDLRFCYRVTVWQTMASKA